VTANLAAALALRGFTVGVLDADIWGFSIPRMLGVEGRLQGIEDDHASGHDRAGAGPGSGEGVGPGGSEPDGPPAADGTPTADGAGPDGSAEGGEGAPRRRGRIAPHRKAVGDGTLEIVSMGFLVEDEGSALMWRGLMLNRAVQHFLEDVVWGDLDYLLIDMPPGTGDVAMGVARMLPRTELLVVTTPAVSAQKVAIRAVDMARKSYLRVAGVIENMSAFTCEHGTAYPLFGEGGGATLAREAGVPLLGQIPIEPAVAAGSDAGAPAVLGDSPAAAAFRAVASRIVDEAVPPIEMAGCSARIDAAPVAPSETIVQVGVPASH
jgi:ATP-binding protein involved in chromosome partitioning